MITINAQNLHYRKLNELIREKLRRGAKHLKLENVVGQRYIGTGLRGEDVLIQIAGTPGEDLAAFADGPTIEVFGNAQNAVGNTMNNGKIIIHGMAGDVIGYGMRGGRIFIRDDVGYRVGIHMKGFKDKQPIIVIGGKARDFFGEYMAGGYLVLLGATGKSGDQIVGSYCATGMHGGVIYIRGQVDQASLGAEVRCFGLDEEDISFLKPLLQQFTASLKLKKPCIFDFRRYTKIIPVSSRPYGRLYAY